tara:strand:+ start:931 stop:1260 length:330 start_codon:yes stop_codon:yes gene_type:complete
MFNDKITKKIAESVKEVLEANNEEVPPVVTGRLPASALQKKKKPMMSPKPDNTGKITKAEAPLVQTGQGDYTKKTMPSDIPTGPVVNVKDTVSKLANRVKGILKPKRKI